MGYEKTKKSVLISLEKFGLGYLDLMLIHFPGTSGLKNNDPKQAENRKGTWQALEEFVDQGLIKSIGVSNYRPKHIQELMGYCRIKPVVNQIELHPFYVEQDTIEECKKYDIIVQAYSPLARADSGLLKHKVINQIAQNKGLEVGQVIMLWHLQNGWVVLPKSEHEDRIRKNIYLEGLSLTEEEFNQIQKLSQKNQKKVPWNPENIA